jgi:CDP-diacylglycerol--serine O-phosphatidyltransferase
MKSKTSKSRKGLSRGIYLLPNLCTTASLFCGFFSIVKSLSGDAIMAAWAILAAGIFDLLDGRIARLAHAESQFGIEYDSLCDLVSFGLAPGILIYTWSLYTLKKFGWLAAFLYFACTAMRLARFNVQHDTIETKRFQGMPSPMAAYTLATFVIFYHHYFTFPPERSWLALGLTIFLALLMISNVGYTSHKEFAFGTRKSFFFLVGLVGLIVIVAFNPEVTLFAIMVAYGAYGILRYVFQLFTKGLRKQKRKEKKKAIPAEIEETQKREKAKAEEERPHLH